MAKWKLEVVVLLAVVALVCLALAIIVKKVASVSPGAFLENDHGASVAAALDLQSCEVLALEQFEPFSDEIRDEHRAAAREGRIIQLANGTDVTQGAVLNCSNKHLIPWTPTGPITGAEETKRRIGVFKWMFPENGPYSVPVCVSASMLRMKYAPL